MLKKPPMYDQTLVKTFRERKVIPPGAYAAVICKVAEGATMSGSEYIEFWIDIIDGEFARYYEEDYKGQTGDKKWRGTVRFFTSERALPMLKGAITSIEQSNPGFTFDWDENHVKGKKVGVLVRREQYEGSDGTLKFSNRPFLFYDIKKVIEGSVKTPKDKLLNKPQTSTPSYAPPSMTPPGYTTPVPTSAPSYPPLTEVGPDDELPF